MTQIVPSPGSTMHHLDSICGNVSERVRQSIRFVGRHVDGWGCEEDCDTVAD